MYFRWWWREVELVWTHVPNEQQGSGIRGRPNKEWPDDIKKWCQMLSANILAQLRIEWRQFVKRVVDTNGYWAQGSQRLRSTKLHQHQARYHTPSNVWLFVSMYRTTEHTITRDYCVIEVLAIHDKHASIT